MSKPEHILAVDAAEFTGIKADAARVLPDAKLCASNQSLFVMERDRAETDERFRHIIPYTVLMNEHGQVLVYERGQGVGEKRLAGSRSVGFGGHVDLHDIRYDKSVIDLHETLQDAAARELHEELAVTKAHISVINEKGILLDNSNAVGRVHVGLLLIANFVGQYQQVRSQEEELIIVGWQKPEEIELVNLEPWSRAVIKSLTKPEVVVPMQPVESPVQPAQKGFFSRLWEAIAA